MPMKQNTLKTFRFFTKEAKKHKLLLTLMIFFLTFATVSSMAWYVVGRNFFAALSLNESKDIIAHSLFQTLIIIMFTELLEWLGWRGFQHAILHFQAKSMADISNECFDYLHLHSYRFFTNNFVGSLVKKVTRFVRAFEQIMDKIFWDMATLVLKVLIVSAVLFYIRPVLGIIIVVWTIIFLLVNYKLAVYKLKFDIPKSEQDSVVTARLADTITNNTNIKLFSNLEYESAKFQKINQIWYERTIKAWKVNAYIEAGQALLMVVLEFVITYASIVLWQKNVLVLADFFLIQTYMLELFRQVWSFGRNVREIYESLADSEEMIAILDSEHEVKDFPGSRNLKISAGKVEFDKVSFAYQRGNESVIKNLSFKIKPGEKVALIGPSGGGKSTLTKLILRLFDIDKGKILIDGQDLSKVTQDSLRKQIALVPQDPILFHRTLRENIRYGSQHASNEDIIMASKMAHCSEFIKKLSHGYDTYVGERGIKLSGGQRQRVAIARAILSKAKILILDEATSSLDSESEKLIQDALKNLIKDKTTFIIAHRLSTIMNVDRIFVLENGRIIEEGTHSDLVSKESGLYKKLWNLQVGGYLENGNETKKEEELEAQLD